MKLDIYNHGKVEKTYTAEVYYLMFGTLEDVAQAVNLDNLKSGTDAEFVKLVLGMAVNSMDTAKALLMDIFPGLTEEELRHVRVTDMATVFVEVVKYTVSQLNLTAERGN